MKYLFLIFLKLKAIRRDQDNQRNSVKYGTYQVLRLTLYTRRYSKEIYFWYILLSTVKCILNYRFWYILLSTIKYILNYRFWYILLGTIKCILNYRFWYILLSTIKSILNYRCA
jgi:hypothetical protein